MAGSLSQFPVKISVPVIHITDLFNPPGDPDDHFDLVTLLSRPEFDPRAVVIDLSLKNRIPGIPTVAKACRLFGRSEVPCEAGLPSALQAETDTGVEQPADSQRAVALVLDALRQADDGSMMITIVGSLRDVCAAYNREPEIFHQKVRRLMVNAGDSLGVVGPRDWNTNLDRLAWRRIMSSGLPIDWFPCNPSKGRGDFNGHVSWWSAPQRNLLMDCPASVLEFFDSEGIPSDAIEERHMWSTVSFVEALRVGPAPVEDLAMNAYAMKPVALRLRDDASVEWHDLAPSANSRARILFVPDKERYTEAMISFFKRSLQLAR